MLRRSHVQFWFRATEEFNRVRSGLSGKERVSKKTGHRMMLFRLRAECDYRVSGAKNKYNASIRLARLNAAAQEHGTFGEALQADLYRQNCLFSSASLVTLAQYEPLAFRALCELASSKIPPPPPKFPNFSDAQPLPDPSFKLRNDVQKILHDGSQRVGSPLHRALATDQRSSDEITDEWINSWKEYESVAESEHIVPSEAMLPQNQ